MRVNLRQRQPGEVAAKQGCSGPVLKEDRVPDLEDTESNDTRSLPRVRISPASYGTATSEALTIAETIAKSV